MDAVSYQTVYMLNRVDRDGLLFDEEKFPAFSKELLTSREPDNKHTLSDVAWGGGDFYSMPIIYEYDNEYYLADVVFNNENKDITKPIVASKAKQHKLKMLYFEKNNGGHEYADQIKENLQKINYYVNVKKVKRKNIKDVKRFSIILYAPEIQKIHLLKQDQRSREYQSFVNNLVAYNQNGKNRNDDAPDSLALLFEFCIFSKSKEVRIIDRAKRII
jgi:predicted phage terminase large subunit-like protein